MYGSKEIIDSLQADLREAHREIGRQHGRISELHAAMVRVAQETPFSDEAESAIRQRGKLLAEVGTLKASVNNLRIVCSDREAAIDEANQRAEKQEELRRTLEAKLALVIDAYKAVHDAKLPHCDSSDHSSMPDVEEAERVLREIEAL